MRNGSASLLVPMAALLLLASLMASSSSILEAVDSTSEIHICDSAVHWQILSKNNYSSQIRLHRHVLLLVTVPWSGESRSLMEELAHVVTAEQEKFGSLKLMVLYRNRERIVADAIGATEGIMILYYHHSLSYKYRGRLRVQNILSSVNYVMSLLPEELPLRSLNSLEDLRIFLDTTDRAILLLEFCGWTRKLLTKGINNGTGKSFGFSEEFNVTHPVEENEKEKGIGNDKMLLCGLQNGPSGDPWLSEFTSVNESAFSESKNLTPGGEACTFDEFQRFELFLAKLVTVIRDFFLPPERFKFGLVHERSMLSYLNVEDSGPWFLTMSHARCPSCSKVIKENDLRSVLQTQSSFVTELEDDMHDAGLALPASKASILLFIDRSSDSPKIQRESKEALNAFRELALQYQNLDEMKVTNTVDPEQMSVRSFQASRSSSKPLRFQASKMITLEDNNKVSVMIVNEGKPIALENFVSEFQGSTLGEIFAHVIRQNNKELKLSSLAKDVGFQLLSDDFDIKVAEDLPIHKEVQTDQVLQSVEGLLEDTVNLDKDQLAHGIDPLDMKPGKLYKSTDAESPKPDNEYQRGMADPLAMKNQELYKSTYAESCQPDGEKNSVEERVEAVADKYSRKKEDASSQVLKIEDKIFLEIEKSKQQEDFKGSFFFIDGQYRLLKKLTGQSNVPSVVIINPSLQQHHVFSEQLVFSYSLLSDFLKQFLNGSLSPYQQSLPVVPSRKEAPIPPFVNLGFHEADSIPQVTTRTFSELVLRKHSGPGNAVHAGDHDVLVLFSNSWCGFCQRMELVVREVYRMIKAYTTMLKKGPAVEQLLLTGDNARHAILKSPLIYLMDCTHNDCSLILKSIVQRELYPALLLFPAGAKNAIPYEGDIAVSGIIRFLASHGNHIYGLLKENSMSSTEAEGINQSLSKQDPLMKKPRHEIVLGDGMHKKEVKYKRLHAETVTQSCKRNLEVVVGSILIATEKLQNVHPFNEAKILIVKVDLNTGFQGLVFNKPIGWDSLEDLEEGLELLKEAPLSFGGPVIKRGMPLVALSRKPTKDQDMEILPNIHFIDQWSTLHLIEEVKTGNRSFADYWFFLGFAGWGWNQLFDEIAEGAWNVSNGKTEQIDWPWR